MIAVIQRAKKASVSIDGKVHCKMDSGLLILLGVRKSDTIQNAELLAEKTSLLRIFPDENSKMNLSLPDIGGEAIVVSQFTLCADNAKSGNRPSFTEAALPADAEFLYEKYISKLKSFIGEGKVKSGVFAAMMDVELVNEGPVTIILEK